MRSFATLLLALSAPLYALAAHGHHRRHTDIAHRARGDLVKRQSYNNARCTYYDITVGTTACGGNFPASAFVVALDSPLFGSGYPGPNCHRGIVIQYNGKTAYATVEDECPGCPEGGLDLTEGLFSYFAPESVGVFYATWSFSDGSSPANPPDTTSSTPKDTPTPIYVPPSPSDSPSPEPSPESSTSYTHIDTTTTTPPPPPPTTSSTPDSYPPPPPTTTSTTPTTSSSPPPTSPPYSPSTPSPSPTPTPTPSPYGGDANGNNLDALDQLMSNYAHIVEECDGNE